MLWGTFGNAASAMNAMSNDLGTISQNIANVNTYGYKSAQTMFVTQLSEQLASPTSTGNYADTNMSMAGTSIFGVGTYTRNLVDTQGSIQSTGLNNDLAINGDGFFIVSPPGASGTAPTTPTLSNPNSAYYTRDGSFTQLAGSNGQAYYVNGAGDYLMGWMADATTGVVNTSTLVPVYTLPTTTMPAVATTTASVNANIPSDATQTANPQGSTATVSDDEIPAQSQTLSLSWSRIDATTWTVSATGVTGGSVGSALPGATDSYTVTTDGLGNVVSMTDGTNTYAPPTQVPFGVTWNDGNPGSPTVNLGSMAPTQTYSDVSLPIYDTSSTSHSLVLGFEKAGADSWYLHFDSPEMHASQSSSTTVTDAAGNNVQMGLTWTPTGGGNLYTVTPSTVSGGDTGSGSVSVQVTNGAISAINGNPVPPATTSGSFFTVTTPGTGAATPTVDLASALPSFPTVNTAPIPVTFDGNGKLVSPTSATVSVTWTNGQTTTTTIDISKMTQYSSGGSDTVTVNATSQNGYLAGTLQTATFQTDGTMLGGFSNGETRTLFQVPLATFIAPNSLTPVSGNMFQYSPGSGAPTVQAVDDIGGGGSSGSGSTALVVGSVEASNVDLQTQMTDMITAQKAYATNSEVFQTADQMLTVIRDLQT